MRCKDNPTRAKLVIAVAALNVNNTLKKVARLCFGVKSD